MAINNFIPQYWSARIFKALQKELVYAQPGIVNRDYEGEIQEAGDTVKINSIGDPTIVDYVKNTDLPDPETLTGAERNLVITQAKAFNFQVDDIDKRQQQPQVMDEGMSRAGYRLKDQMDQYVGALMAAKAKFTIGSSGSPKVIDNAAVFAYNLLIQAKVKLDENNVPKAGRFAVVPSWFEAALALDSRFVGTRGYDNNTVLLNGSAGTAAGFNVLISPNVPNTGNAKYKVVAGISGATTLAEQINKVEAGRMEKRFADYVKGLHLYGAEVIRSYELVCITVNDGLELAGAGPEDPAA
jgi:N4-gp56 family major capsid protein